MEYVVLPAPLDLLTVFFIAAGCALLWLNLRPRPPHIVITKADDVLHQSGSTGHAPANTQIHPLLDVIQRHLSEASANPGAEQDNAYANRVAEGIAKVKKTPD
jgi:hypothetical protein